MFRTPESYWYDPFDPSELQGWRLSAGGYQALVPDARGWLWSPALQVWIGRWEGVYKRDAATWLRFYKEGGQLVWTLDEAAEQRAEAERTRAEAAEAEVGHLRAELAQLCRETC